MATKQQDKPEKAAGDEGARQGEAHVAAGVLQALGQPPGWHRVQVRRVGEASFRVNVFMGTGATNAAISHSFFVVTDGEGNITRATPAITRLY